MSNEDNATRDSTEIEEFEKSIYHLYDVVMSLRQRAVNKEEILFGPYLSTAIGEDEKMPEGIIPKGMKTIKDITESLEDVAHLVDRL